MLSRLLAVASVATLMTVGAQGRLLATDGFEVMGLEQLEARYGQAFPGYAGLGSSGMQLGSGGSKSQSLSLSNLNVQPSMSMGWNMASSPALSLSQIPQMQQAPQQFTLATTALSNQATVMPDYGVAALSSLGVNTGGVGALGAGGMQLGTGGTSKGTSKAQPIYAQAMVVPKIITQPILRPHAVTQPIVQQQLIQQPIVETRQIIQPVIRRIVTQPIIRPEIYESTTVQPTLKQETIVQPHIIQQTVVTPQLQNQFEEAQPIQEAAKVTVAPTNVQATVREKKSTGGLGMF